MSSDLGYCHPINLKWISSHWSSSCVGVGDGHSDEGGALLELRGGFGRGIGDGCEACAGGLGDVIMSELGLCWRWASDGGGLF